MSFFNLLAVVGLTLLPLSVKAQSFCTPKTDYLKDAICSGTFKAETQGELDSYLQDYGIEDGKYKSLEIGFALGQGGGGVAISLVKYLY